MTDPDYVENLRQEARRLRMEARRRTDEAKRIETMIHAHDRDQFDKTPPGLGGPPTWAELADAEERIGPYLHGYPQPMIDSRRLRIANRVASLEERRAVAAEDAVWKKHEATSDSPLTR